eukprot:TRINITY_DN6453_c0_g2_i1.p1 TRINITY_DN6453_c0_g2~~TRINITY_DN6453_c0_g2_i1.p1  ORF type:complete len:574 (-),score=89.97 TRINITY_DN6453_c0_g2_i1:88-1809(-)
MSFQALVPALDLQKTSPPCSHDISEKITSDDDLFVQAARQWGSALITIAGSSRRHAVFDCTRIHVHRLYKVLVGADDHHMDLEGFQRGLEAECFQVEENNTPRASLLKAVFKVAAEGKETMNLQQFHVVLKRLKLHVLLLKMASEAGNSDSGKQVRGCCLDWSPDDLQCQMLMAEDWQQHLFVPRASCFSLRWCHYTEPDKTTLLSVGALNQLHLRALDIYNSPLGETNIWVRGEDYNILVPIVRLTQASKSILREFREEARSGKMSPPQSRVVVALETAQLYLFVSSKRDVVVTTLSRWKTPAVTRQMQRDQSVRKGRRHRSRRVEDSETLAAHTSEHDHGSQGSLRIRPASSQIAECLAAFESVLLEVERDYSELRTGDAYVLTFSILVSVLLDHVEVHEAYRARLKWFEGRVEEHMQIEVCELKRSLGHHARLLDDFAEITEKVGQCPNLDAETRNHLKGMRTKVIQLSRDSGEIIEMCDALLDEVKAQTDVKEHHVSFSISLMVTLLLPWQFLTGVYGMNFQDDEGKGVVPLLGFLTLDNSYFMFWGLGLLMMLLIAAWLRHAGLLRLY